MILIRTTVTEERPPDVAKRVWPVIMREAHQDMGEYWHENMLPDHFTRAAKHKYNHEERGADYERRKKGLNRKGQRTRRPARYGGEVDNVLTGQSEDDLRNQATIRGFPTRATLTMNAPAYFTMRYFKKKQPDKVREITEVTRDEAQKLADVLNESATKRLDAYRATKVTRP